MKTKNIVVISILVIVVLIALYFLFLTPKIDEVEFLTDFSESKEVNCFGGNLGAGCYVNLTFSYNGKDYVVQAIHSYQKDPQKDLGITSPKLINNQLKIKGFYDSRKNLLFNFTAIE